jgi:hypothetical protein
MKTKTLEEAFEDGDSIVDYLDLSTARRGKPAAHRVNVDFPVPMLAKLDAQAKARGVTRQALIKMWLADRLDAAA